MNQVKENVRSLMERLQFYPEAVQVLAEALDRIAADRVASAWLTRLITQYEENEKCAYKQMLRDARAMGEALGIHAYTAELLLFLCLGEKLRERYIERGLDEQLFYDAMADLRYKLEECRLVQGQVGSFVASWFAGFFDMTRFALGRLQFEMVTLKKDFTMGSVTVPAGRRAINMHIPRTGTRLNHDEVLASYRRAAEMFASEFADGPVLFTCSSWLLYPWNSTILSPTSNLLAFYRDFCIVDSGEYGDYGETWRLVDCQYTGDPAALPQETSLRRAYAERIARGEPLGWGRGLFFYRDGQVCHE